MSQTSPLTATAPLAVPYTTSGSQVSEWIWLGSVTTLWTPPSSCDQISRITTCIATASGGGDFGGHGYEDSCFIGVPFAHMPGFYRTYYPPWDESYQTCWPPIPGNSIDAPSSTLDSLVVAGVYYSPALCPNGWSASLQGSNHFGTRSGTALACCPPSWTHPTSGGILCTQSIPNGALMTNVWFKTGGNTLNTVYHSTDVLVNTKLPKSSILGIRPVLASFELTDTFLSQNFQAQSQGPLTASSTSVASASTSNQGTSSSAPGSTTTPSRPQTGKSGLSPGARAGIAIAIVTIFIVIIVAIFLFFRRRRRRPAQETKPDEGPNIPELITSSNTHEMGTKHNLPELGEQNKKWLLGTNPILGEAVKVNMLDSESKALSPALDPDQSKISELSAGPIQGPLKRKAVGGEQHSPVTLQSTEEAKHIEVPADNQKQTPRFEAKEKIERPKDDERHKGVAETEHLPEALSLATHSGTLSVTPASSQEEKLKLLRARMDQIRIERERLERLERLQELKDIEEATQKEILEAEKSAGTT